MPTLCRNSEDFKNSTQNTSFVLTLSPKQHDLIQRKHPSSTEFAGERVHHLSYSRADYIPNFVPTFCRQRTWSDWFEYFGLALDCSESF